MVGTPPITLSLPRPYNYDLEDIESYRKYLIRCTKSTMFPVYTTSRRLVELPDTILKNYLEESRSTIKYNRLQQDDMYIIGSTILSEFGLAHWDERLVTPIGDDFKDIETFRHYLQKCSNAKNKSVSKSAAIMLNMSDEDLAPFLLEAQSMVKYIKIRQEDM